MAHRRGGPTLQVGDAANVGRGDDLWLHLAEVAQLAVAQLVRNLWIQHRVGAGRAAAQV